MMIRKLLYLLGYYRQYLTLKILPDGRHWCGPNLFARNFESAQKQAETKRLTVQGELIEEIPASDQLVDAYRNLMKTQPN